MAMIGSIAREYISVIERIRHGQFQGRRELRWLEGQRGLLHRQLCELTGRAVSVATARRLAARSR